ARGVPPGFGSYASKEDRLDSRLAAALMGIQAVKGVDVGDGFTLAGERGSAGPRGNFPPPRGGFHGTNTARGDRGRGRRGGRFEGGGERGGSRDEAAADADAPAALRRPRDRRARGSARRA